MEPWITIALTALTGPSLTGLAFYLLRNWLLTRLKHQLNLESLLKKSDLNIAEIAKKSEFKETIVHLEDRLNKEKIHLEKELDAAKSDLVNINKSLSDNSFNVSFLYEQEKLSAIKKTWSAITKFEALNDFLVIETALKLNSGLNDNIINVLKAAHSDSHRKTQNDPLKYTKELIQEIESCRIFLSGKTYFLCSLFIEIFNQSVTQLEHAITGRSTDITQKQYLKSIENIWKSFIEYSEKEHPKDLSLIEMSSRIRLELSVISAENIMKKDNHYTYRNVRDNIIKDDTLLSIKLHR
tara:strand:+ start:131 stop:1018 length:888 start_codon:yes stop_codon:yes gene_type:complete